MTRKAETKFVNIKLHSESIFRKLERKITRVFSLLCQCRDSMKVCEVEQYRSILSNISNYTYKLLLMKLGGKSGGSNVLF